MGTSENNQEKAQTQTETISNEESYLYYPIRLQDEPNENLEKAETEIEKKFAELLAAISDETLQLSEFLIEEKRLIQELCELFREILKRLKMSFEIPTKVVPEFQGKAKKILLNDEGHLLLILEGENVSSKILEDYPPEVVLNVIWNIIPALEKSLKAYRRKISKRVGIFERIKKELKSIHNVFSSSEQKQGDFLIIGNQELKSPLSNDKTQNDYSSENVH